MKKHIPKLPNIESTAAGLRDALFDEINALRRGEDTLRRAKAIAQLAHRIIEAARIALEVNSGLSKELYLGTTAIGELRTMLKKSDRDL